MQPFRHGRLQTLERLLARSNAVLVKYNNSDLDLPQELAYFLDDSVASYKTLALSIGENALLSMKAQFVSAQNGTNPLTLERITSHRRTLERAIALSVLQRSTQQLRTDIASNDESLSLSRERLVPITLNAFKKGLVPESPITPSDIEALWKTIMLDSDLRTSAQQAAMMAHPADVFLLLGDLLAAVD
jgi:hypothetical protein